MIEGAVGVLLVAEELVHLVDVLPGFGDVQRSEVLEKALVAQVLASRNSTLSMLKKKALGISLGGLVSAR
jgi:hypothetical protein